MSTDEFGQRCYITECSSDVLREILEYLSFRDKVQLSLTCQTFMKLHLHGPLEISSATQGPMQHRSPASLIHLVENMSAEPRSRIRKLFMHSSTAGIAELPDLQTHRICTLLIGNLTVLRMHDVFLRLEALDAPGAALRLEVLDLTGSVLVAKAHPSLLDWPLLTSNSPTLRCLTLRKVLVHVPKLKKWKIPDPPIDHVVLPRLKELDITECGAVDYKPSGDQYFKQRRDGVFRHPCYLLPPQCFKGASSLTTLRFSPVFHPSRFITASTWEYFPNLQAFEYSHNAQLICIWHVGYPVQFLPPSLTEFTVRLWPAEWTNFSTGLIDDFRHMVKAAHAGVRLQKLTLIGYTVYDAHSFAVEAYDSCLAGIKELVLEPRVHERDLVVLQDRLITYSVDLILPTFPGLERLQVRGQRFASLTSSVSCLHLEELSISFCPGSINMICPNLRSLRVEYTFSCFLAERAGEFHALDMNAYVCGRLDSLTIVLSSYKIGDTFQVHCKHGTAMCGTVSYPADEWGKWVIGVRFSASICGQVEKVTFECATSHGSLAWNLAE